MNCFAERHGSCMILNDTHFKHDKCPFYKHIDVYKAELKKYPYKNYMAYKGMKVTSGNVLGGSDEKYNI